MASLFTENSNRPIFRVSLFTHDPSLFLEKSELLVGGNLVSTESNNLLMSGLLLFNGDIKLLLVAYCSHFRLSNCFQL